MTVETLRVPTRDERIASLRKRDGDFCMHPDCGKEIDFTITDGPWAVTEDHWFPRHAGGSNEVENLKLMHRRCNQLKGDLIPHEDGTLPKRRVSTFRRRSEKRSGRQEVCETCNSGREIKFGQTCPVCGSGPQPELFPRAYKVDKPSDCSHSGLEWCWGCTGIGLYEREPASKTVFDGDYFDE